MRPPADIAWSRQLAGISVSLMALWGCAAMMVIAAHGAAGWWIMQERTTQIAEAGEPAAIMIEFAPEPAAPMAVEEQIAPDEIDAQAAEEVPTEAVTEEAEVTEPIEPEPVEDIVEDINEDLAETIDQIEPIDPIEQQVAALDPVELPLPQSRPEPPRKKPAPAKAKAQPSAEKRRAQVRTPREAPRAAAAQNSSGASATISPARWQARLASHLERRKRYPAAARRQRQQGTAQVRFTIDAAGNVQSVALVRSSGVPVLDEEVVALVRRASPVPAPPPGINRTIVVPIRFSVR